MKKVKVALLIGLCFFTFNFLNIMDVQAAVPSGGLDCVYYSSGSSDAIEASNTFIFTINQKKQMTFELFGKYASVSTRTNMVNGVISGDQDSSFFASYFDNNDSCPSQVYYAFLRTTSNNYEGGSISLTDFETIQSPNQQVCNEAAGITTNCWEMGTWIKKTETSGGEYEGQTSYEGTELVIDGLIYYQVYGKSKITIAKTNVTVNGEYTGTIWTSGASNSDSHVIYIKFDVNDDDVGDLKNILDNKNTDKYPRYLVETKEYDENKKANVWRFTNDLNKLNEKVEINTNNVYILSKYYLSLIDRKDDLTETCENLFGTDFLNFLNNNVIKTIYIGIPILLILLTTFDFAKVVFIDDKDGIQNAFKKMTTRIIAAVLIFLVPNIIIFANNIIGSRKVEECSRAIKQGINSTKENSEDIINE